MSITAKIYIEHDRLALVPTLRRLDGIGIRVVTQGNTDPGKNRFPFFIEYDDRAELEAALDTDPTVDSYELVDWSDETGIYYIQHSSEAKLISPIVTEVNGFLMNTETQRRGWFVRLLLPDREALSTVWDYAAENDISLEVFEIYGNEDAGGEASYGLTDEQTTALRLAYDRGYFNEPRDASLQELASDLNLSSTAMSGRLRRGMRNLLAATVAEVGEQ